MASSARSDLSSAAELLKQILRYCDTRGVAPSRFGRQAVRDPRLVRDLRDGRQITAQRANRIRAFMKEAAQ